ncbi:MAG TPA: histidine kinase [Actinomycetes bacterium]|nr:histidine kinase [Actinomycetes bacterium]
MAGERGGATLIGLGLAGLILLVGVVAVDVGGLVGARAAAQTAADMAALAALTPRGGPVVRPAAGVGEARAAEISAANGAELVGCDCSAVKAVVSVRRRVRLVPGTLTVVLTARARAVLAAPNRPEWSSSSLELGTWVAVGSRRRVWVSGSQRR